MTSDLFDTPILPGLRMQPDLIDQAEEQMLIARIDAADLTPFRFQGWTGKRLTTSFGWRYDFEVGRPSRRLRSPTGCVHSGSEWRFSGSWTPKT